jgi:hypothetical protein
MRWIVSFVLIVAVVVGGGFGYLYASAKTPEAWFRQQCMTDAHNRAESKQIATGEDIEKRVAAFREENQTLIECKDKARSLAVSFLSSHYDETRITMMVDACEPKYAHQIPSGISAELERGAVNAICREDAIRAIWYFEHPVQYRIGELAKCSFNRDGYDDIDCRQTPGDYEASVALPDPRVFEAVLLEIKRKLR